MDIKVGLLNTVRKLNICLGYLFANNSQKYNYQTSAAFVKAFIAAM